VLSQERRRIILTTSVQRMGRVAQQRRAASADPSLMGCFLTLRGKKRRGLQGFPEYFTPAEGQQRFANRKIGSAGVRAALDRQGIPWWSATRTARHTRAGPAWPDPPQGWFFNPPMLRSRRAFLYDGLDDIIHNGMTRAGEPRIGVQRVAEILRQIPDRARVRNEGREP